MSLVEVDTDATRRLLLVGGVSLALFGSFWVVSGLSGVLVAGVVVAVWLSISTLYAYATGQLLYAILLSDGLALGSAEFFGVQFALGVLLATKLRPSVREPWVLVLALVAFGIAGVVLATAATVEPFWVGATLLALAYGLLAYGLHRYELVALDLVEEVSG